MENSTEDAWSPLLLLAIHNYFLKNQDYAEIDVEDLIELKPMFPAGFIRAVAEELEEEELLKKVRVTRNPGYGTEAYILTRKGLHIASGLRAGPAVEDSAEVGSPAADDMRDRGVEQTISVPASDRIVRIDDNAPGLAAAVEHLTKVVEELESGSNEIPLDKDERKVIANEIRPLLQRLNDGCVRVGEVFSAVTKGSPLIWLLDKVGGTAVAAAVASAIAALGLLANALAG